MSDKTDALVPFQPVEQFPMSIDKIGGQISGIAQGASLIVQRLHRSVGEKQRQKRLVTDLAALELPGCFQEIGVIGGTPILHSFPR